MLINMVLSLENAGTWSMKMRNMLEMDATKDTTAIMNTVMMQLFAFVMNQSAMIGKKG